MAAWRSVTREPFWMTEAETVREWRDLEREACRLDDDDARLREQRDAYYPAPTSEGSAAA